MASAAGDLVVRLTANTRRFDSAMSRARKAAGRFASASGVAMAGVAVAAAGATIAIIAMGNAFSTAARKGEEFNQKMRQSTAIMGELSSVMRSDMVEAALDVARVTKNTSAEAAEAFFFLASAGLDAEQSIAALHQVALFSQAGMFDLASATDLATDAQSALGITVKDPIQNLKNLTRVTDVLVKANTLANASVEQFSQALTNKAGASLKILNKDIEEGVAVLAAFADQGLKGSEAGTALGIVLRDLSTKAIKFKDQFRAAGIAVFDAGGNMNNLADIVGDLENRLSSMSDIQKKATLLQLGFSDKSVIFIQSLLGSSEAIREYEKELRKAGGTTKEVADKQLTEWQKAMAKIDEASTRAGLAIAEEFSPAIRQLGEDAAAAIGPVAKLGATLADLFVRKPVELFAGLKESGNIAVDLLKQKQAERTKANDFGIGFRFDRAKLEALSALGFEGTGNKEADQATNANAASLLRERKLKDVEHKRDLIREQNRFMFRKRFEQQNEDLRKAVVASQIKGENRIFQLQKQHSERLARESSEFTERGKVAGIIPRSSQEVKKALEERRRVAQAAASKRAAAVTPFQRMQSERRFQVEQEKFRRSEAFQGRGVGEQQFGEQQQFGGAKQQGTQESFSSILRQITGKRKTTETQIEKNTRDSAKSLQQIAQDRAEARGEEVQVFF